jgi:hypothetical protein
MPSRKTPNKSGNVKGFVGLGLDQKDETRRMTESEHFLLVGGSAETHERMQDVAIRFDEKLKGRGKRLEDASHEEAMDLLRDSIG